MKNSKLFSFFIGVFFFSSTLFSQLANWTPVPGGTNFPTNVSGQINGIARISQMKFHPTNTSKFYCVTGEGGLFLTNNQASSWTVAPGTETLTSSCAAICVDYTNDQIFYLGTGDANYYSNGIGILKSTNGGASFSATGLTNCLVIEILQNPTNASEFVAATNKGIYKSTNSGATWIATTATTLQFCDLKANATPSSQILYSATRENVPKLLRSIDYGSTWTQITSGIVVSNTVITGGARIAVTPADPNVVYFEVIGDGGIVHKSNDAGLNFILKKPGGSPFLTYYSNTVTSSSQGNYNNAITVDLVDPAKIWLQSHNTWFSSDSGATWTMQTFWANIVHTDMHQIQKAPFDNSKLYSCNDGGVWLSTDGGNNWVTKSDGLYAMEIGSETGVSSFVDKDFVSIGTQDNGRLYANTNGWFTNGGGDDYAQRQFDYNGNIYFDGVNRQINHTGASGPYNLPTTNWNAFGFNRTNPNLGFVGYTDVYRTTNLNSSSPTWTAISNFNQTIRAIHSCISDPNRLYVLLNNGTMYVSTNALSMSPTFLLYVLPSGASASNRGSIVSVVGNPNVVYVCANNIVYRSANSGSTWTNITYNLPNVTHRRILAEDFDGSQELVFVATNNAVYYKKASQTTWTNYSTNLPSRRSPTGFSMFDNGTNQARIRYASFGRAIWESGFDNLRAYNAAIIFNSDTTLTCSSPSLKLEDGSVGINNGPLTYTWNFPGGTPTTVNTSTASVTYTVSGTYIISLTIKDALNAISTKTLSKFIQVINCNTDTIPGKAIYIDGSSNYATTPPIALGITNSITLSAWIKIDAVQPSFAGIIFSGNGNGTGLNFRNGNQIGYHYDGLSNTYNYAGGPTIPMNVWVHVALATSVNSSTIYVNGVPYINNIGNSPVNFSSGFNIGNDRNNTTRTMSGQIDEVCFYNRTLSQNEIRELMHLTRNHTGIDPALKSYYQFNELGQNIYDRAGNSNGSLNGSSQHQLSTAPVGSGNSERMTITASGIKNFPNEGMSLNFPTGSLPNGEICVTRLNIQPDSFPANKTFSTTAQKYWIVNNYGTNATFNSVSNVSLAGYGTISTLQSPSPRIFKLYRRATGDYLASTWTKIDSAYSASSGTNAVLSYSGSAISFFNTQFTVGQDSCTPSLTPTIIATTNTLCLNSSAFLAANGTLNDAASWKWYTGACGSNYQASGFSYLATPSITTTYFVRGEAGCANNGLCSSITISVITSPLTPSVVSGPTVLCEGSSTAFSITNATGTNNYNWTIPSSWSGSSSTSSITVSNITSSGTLSVSASNACGTSQTKTLSVVVNPTVAVTQSVNLCYGQNIIIGSNTYSATGTYTNQFLRNTGCDSLVISSIHVEPSIDVSTSISGITILANAIGASYQWIKCDDKSILPGETGQSLSNATDGSYAVIVTLNNCSDTSACVNITTVGLNKSELNTQVKIYPNPVSQKLIIETRLSSGTISLMTVLGQEITSKNIVAGQIESIDFSDLAKGIYLIKIESDGKLMIEKIIKE
ncbi:LamG-like jellyroll fold domain-containing protein [Aurantibacillus circumpalustris]|uniref:LamG-like jellyroll fold domain-containing protein n=1 Tax=Aurantibacillus circumpalustris TaxID=3036359 RepID=UPI00295C2009|nr:LamG-like jellyroll fold domain-containing protein [Aurantibacillus circumpalustris]